MPLSDDTRKKLMTVSVATLCTALFKRGLRNQFIQDVRPLNPKLPNMVGEAFTLRYIPAREDLDTMAIYARNDGLHRKVLSWGVRTLIRTIHGVPMRSDGPYLFRRVLFDPEQLTPDSFFLNFEFPLRVVRAQLPFETVTISCRPRLAGQSKSAKLSQVTKVGRELLELRVRTTREAVRRALGS